MAIEITVTDSHRNLPKSYWEKLGDFYSEEVWNCKKKEACENVKTCFSLFETDYAVKWFEILAWEEHKIVGCMRVLRNPDDETGWFFCDVHTAKHCRKQGVASKMYEEALELVKEYQAAEYVEATVSRENVASIRLHYKFGFQDTNEEPHFASFTFEDDETIYRVPVYTEYPVVDTEVHRKILYKLYRAYLKESDGELPHSVAREVKRKMQQYDSFRIIWCGNKAVGFVYENGGENIYYIKGKQKG